MARVSSNVLEFGFILLESPQMFLKVPETEFQFVKAASFGCILYYKLFKDAHNSICRSCSQPKTLLRSSGLRDECRGHKARLLAIPR